MPAVSTVSGSGNADIDGLLSGYRWTSGSISFSFTTSSSQYDYSVTGFQAFNDAQKTATKLALANFAAVANLNFTEASGGAGTLRFAESSDAGTAYAYYPHSSDIGGDAFFNRTDYNTAAKGTYSYLTFMHEIGHTLGLDHGQDGSGKLPSNHDSLEYSVMTYRSYVGAPLTGYTVAEGSYPTTLMLADLAAIQYMYGANYGTNAGNSVYKWNPSTGALSINGSNKGASTTNKVFLTIWDGSGTDTYDFSDYTTSLKVNLGAGEWTTTSSAQLADLGNGHSARGNIANAWLHKNNTASLIENATGGSGNDLIVGNQAKNVLKGGSGNDSLKGLSGSDTLSGGSGTDTAYFSFASTVVVVTYDSSAQVYLVTYNGETDRLSSIEYFRFTDKTVTAGVMVPDAPALMKSTPADGTAEVRDDANIVLTFSENVYAGKGKIVIYKSNGTVFQSFDMSTKPDGVTISGKTVTIDPKGYFAGKTGYYVTIERGALKDADSKAFSGISDKSDLAFVTEAPVIRGTSASDHLAGTSSTDRFVANAGNDTVLGGGGHDTLDGGKGYDSMNGGNGNDTYYVDSSRDQIVEAGGMGTDLVISSVTYKLPDNVEKLTLSGSADIDGTGNAHNNTLTGNSGHNRLKGLVGDDKIKAYAGNDKLYGGLGNDTLTGGEGKDKFIFDATLAAANVDTITDFSVADDTIWLSRSIFTVLPEGALSNANFARKSDGDSSKAKIIYDSSTGSLFYDRDGSGSKYGDVKFAILDKGLALTHADFLIV